MNNFYLDREKLISYLKELAKILRKNKSQKCELIIVGGGSILINYSFRYSTTDIDCYDAQGILMNNVINQITEKYSLEEGWINTDFINTESFTPKIIQYSSYFATFSNVLEIRTIKNEYLLAMKLVSARDYKNDLSDVFGIVKEIKEKENRDVTLDGVKKAVKDLYGDESKVKDESYALLVKAIENPSLYDQYVEFEKTNKEIRIQKRKENK